MFRIASSRSAVSKLRPWPATSRWRQFSTATNTAILYQRGIRPTLQRTRLVTQRCQRRGLFESVVTLLNSHVSPVLFPPALFVSLLGILWLQKCIMMIIFQNKIIYMPSLPPFSRQEKIEDYNKGCGPVIWREERIRSLDRTRLSICIGEVRSKKHHETSQRRILLLYFQG